jgi:asparagine synthase (glutamine-hydrolysing)
MSDVPVSIMLSGGIDSALLAFLIKDLSDSGLNTFTAGYSSDNNLNNNEILYARETSNWLNSNHHEVLIKEKSFFQISRKLIEIVEEPVSSQSLLPFYFLTKAIHEKGYKVSFSGQGVDEAFAGYNRYRFQNLYDLSPNRLFKFLFFLKPYLRNDNLRRGLNSLMEPIRSKRYIESNSYFEKDKIGEILNKTNQFPKDSENVFLTLLNKTADKFNSQDLDGINYHLRMDTLFTLPDDLLLYTDKIAMHHSIEVRVPFLDLELMNFLESLPTKYKSSLFSSKILHRKLSDKYLPKEIINRKKNGFYIPRRKWFKSSEMNELKEEILSDQTIFSKIFNKTYLIGIINDHQIGKYNYENQIFSLMNLFYWFKLNMNNEY